MEVSSAVLVMLTSGQVLNEESVRLYCAIRTALRRVGPVCRACARYRLRSRLQIREPLDTAHWSAAGDVIQRWLVGHISACSYPSVYLLFGNRGTAGREIEQHQDVAY